MIEYNEDYRITYECCNFLESLAVDDYECIIYSLYRVRHIYGSAHFIKFLNKKTAKFKIYYMGL